MTTSIINRFPKTAADQAEVCDSTGTRWKYDLETKSWIQIGKIDQPPIVTEKNNGILTPDIYAQLELILSTFKNKQSLKIIPGTDAYWYYLRSSDKLVRFRPEGENTLRIEIDKGRFFQLIMKEKCQGKRGQKGNQGAQGKPGTPGPDELYYQPTVNQDKLDFAIITPTPLNNLQTDITLTNNHVPDISVRLYRITANEQTQKTQKIKKLSNNKQSYTTSYDQLNYLSLSNKELSADVQNARQIIAAQAIGIKPKKQIIRLSDVLVIGTNENVDQDPSITILIDPTNTTKPRLINNSEIDIDEQATLETIKFEDQIVFGSIIVKTNTWSHQWAIKSRQCGLDGTQGQDGESTIRIVNCTIDNSSVIAICPIINSRLDCDSRTIYTLCNQIINSVCVGSVNLNNNGNLLSDKKGTSAHFAAVQMTLSECKPVRVYQATLGDDKLPDLELKYWEPQAGCMTERHYSKQSYDWVSQTNDDYQNINIWVDANHNQRSGSYPHPILIPKRPPNDVCCQEDFFYCPNIQTGGCEPTTTTQPTPPPSSGELLADFSYTPSQPSIRVPIQFEALPSGGSSPYSYLWNFGDTNGSSLASPSHMYFLTGAYTVTLIITDSAGNTATKNRTVTIS